MARDVRTVRKLVGRFVVQFENLNWARPVATEFAVGQIVVCRRVSERALQVSAKFPAKGDKPEVWEPWDNQSERERAARK